VENSSIDKNNSPKMKILLAEDDASMRRFFEITLQRADYKLIKLKRTAFAAHPPKQRCPRE